MIPGSLPFDYVRYVDRGDRVRRSHMRPNGDRVRRGHARRGSDAETA